MTWQSQTREYILFVSPENNVFSALWKNNERSFEKKLGQFDPPKFRGTYVQDMDVKSTVYPLTVYFEGATHYSTANKFYDALFKEKGQWEITHPTKGVLILQLVSAREIINPIDDGNFTGFETQWIEPANIERFISAPELGVLVLLEILNAISDGIAQAQQLKADLYSAVQSAINTMNQITGFVDSVMSEIAALQTLINDSWNEAKNSYDNLITAFQTNPFDTDTIEELSQSVVDIISIPLEASDSYDTRMSLYNELSENFYTLAPGNTGFEDYNRIVFLEIGIISVMISYSRIIVTSNFTTRVQVINAMDNLTTFFNDLINFIESVQERFEGKDIDLQYFSASKCYTSIQNVFALTIKYLLTQFFNLKTEKRFTLKRDRHPLEITVTEYGDAEQYDLFINSNNLSGKEILLLPAGSEVVIYA